MPINDEKPYAEQDLLRLSYRCKVRITVGPYHRWIEMETTVAHVANGLFDQINQQIAAGKFQDCAPAANAAKAIQGPFEAKIVRNGLGEDITKFHTPGFSVGGIGSA